jgi:N-acetyl-alpha-D-muramate 1-phosphate uridylyltransferase
MTPVGTHAMVLAAGFGTRMQPLTSHTPKPLIKVNGKPLLDYAMDSLAAAAVRHAVVNVHYLPEQIEAWAKTKTHPLITISDERDAILDTGGGISRALPLLGDAPFFVLNSDSFWREGEGVPALMRLRQAWLDEAMDCLLLLCDPARITGYDGHGDFVLGEDGRLIRNPARKTGKLAYIGGYLVHPRLFQEAPPGKYSMNVLWDRAIAAGRLFGLAHSGHWLHVGTPEAIGQAEAFLAAKG